MVENPTGHTVSVEIAGRTLSIETGRYAEQAQGAVMVRYGDSVVLVTAGGERTAREEQDFFPLSVDYEEKMYAAGKIPGGFIKREGRPTENAILSARLTDRPIRPLFPKGYRAEVQIISSVLSADQENDPALLSIIGASAALMISPIPFDGPVGAVRVGMFDGEIVINPSLQDLDDSDLDMVVAGTSDAIMMVEGEANEIPEDTLIRAIEAAHQEIKEIVALQFDLQDAAGQEKWEVAVPQENEELYARVESVVGEALRAAVNNPDKVMRMEGTDEVRKGAIEQFTAAVDGDDASVYSTKDVGAAFDKLLKRTVRDAIISDGIRPDGRAPGEIRPIWTEVGVLPRTHGSAVFTRGQTQVLTIATLGSAAEEQRLDSISPEVSKRYIHHYNFPPFSVGEVRRLRGASRRDIGHGALAERALKAVLPSEAEFPYTIRLVSEVLSSNGSSSMASVCGSTMSLMDAGVPITAPVAGIAMGLVTEPDTDAYTVLSDIQGMEDALGDMDFKVAGTSEGVTAIQMDIKIRGLSFEVMRQALAQANAGRMFILGKMAETIAGPRQELSQFAPRVTRLKVNPEKIGAIIGPGGKMIRAIQEETGTKIDIEDDGTVSIASTDPVGAERAIERIRGLTQEIRIEKGEIYNGKIVSIMPYGAFVELVPGRDGLVHISELSEDPSVRVAKVEDMFQVGDEINVMVIDVAPNGKVSLSRRAALTGEMPEERPRPPRREGGDRGPRRDGNRDRGPRRD
ncbi:MAG: polyribonucleotide nucleotidyltransferase [Thermomicrobiales bacterium]|nr:polyribonucleotide nucleotidyltransferase [Thermomicrobiales bacterium]